MGNMSGDFMLVVVMAVRVTDCSLDYRNGGKRQNKRQVEVAMA
jgi:hypothetical protein